MILIEVIYYKVNKQNKISLQMTEKMRLVNLL